MYEIITIPLEYSNHAYEGTNTGGIEKKNVEKHVVQCIKFLKFPGNNESRHA